MAEEKKDNTVMILALVGIGFVAMNPGMLGGSGSGGSGFIITPTGRIPVSQAQQHGYVYYPGSSSAPAGWYHVSQFPSPPGTAISTTGTGNNTGWVSTVQGILNTASSITGAVGTIMNMFPNAQTTASAGSSTNWGAVDNPNPDGTIIAGIGQALRKRSLVELAMGADKVLRQNIKNDEWLFLQLGSFDGNFDKWNNTSVYNLAYVALYAANPATRERALQLLKQYFAYESRNA